MTNESAIDVFGSFPLVSILDTCLMTSTLIFSPMLFGDLSHCSRLNALNSGDWWPSYNASTCPCWSGCRFRHLHHSLRPDVRLGQLPDACIAFHRIYCTTAFFVIYAAHLAWELSEVFEAQWWAFHDNIQIRRAFEIREPAARRWHPSWPLRLLKLSLPSVPLQLLKPTCIAWCCTVQWALRHALTSQQAVYILRITLILGRCVKLFA